MRPAALVGKAVEAGVLTPDEARQLADAEAARAEAVEVDAFPLDAYLAGAVVTEAVDGLEPVKTRVEKVPADDRAAVL